MRRIAAALMTFCIAFTGMFCPVYAEELPVYRMSESFGETQNADAGWSYGYAAPQSSAYELFDYFYTFADVQWWSKTMENNWDYGRMGQWQCAPADNMDVAYIFTFPQDGIARVEAPEGISLHPEGNGVNAALFKDETMIWPESETWQTVQPGETAAFPALTVSGHAGEKLYFRVNSGGNAKNDNTSWDMSVTFTSNAYDAAWDPEIFPVAEIRADFSAQQGQGHWNYVFASAGAEDYAPLNHSYENESGVWWSQDMPDNWNVGRVGNAVLTPSGEKDVAYAYTFFRDGTFEICAENLTLPQGGDGCSVGVYKNGTLIWPQGGMGRVEAGGSLAFDPILISGHKGDVLYFRVNSGEQKNSLEDYLSWNPVIRYQNFRYDLSLDPEGSVLPPPSAAMDFLPESGEFARNGAWSFDYAKGSLYEPYDQKNDAYWTKNANLESQYGYVSGAWNSVTPGWDYDAAFSYTLPKDGHVVLLGEGESVSFHPDKTGSLEASISIYKNDVRIWPLESEEQRIDAKATAEEPAKVYTFPALTLSGKAGDVLHFRISRGAEWNAEDSLRWSPTVTYTDLVYTPEDDPEKAARYEFASGFSDEQWANGWGYLYAGIGDDFTIPQRGYYDGGWSAGSGNYTTGQIFSNGVLPGIEQDAVIGFKVPVTGNITITMRRDQISVENSVGAADAGDGVAVGISRSASGEVTPVWPGEGLQVLENGAVYDFAPLTLDVRKNEILLLRVNRGPEQNWHDMVTMLPVITYNTQDPGDPGLPEPGDTERVKRQPGADPAKLPGEVTQAPVEITAAQLKELMLEQKAQGAYTLQEDLVLDEAFGENTWSLDGVKLCFEGGKLLVSADGVRLENGAVEGTVCFTGENGVLMNSRVTEVEDASAQGIWIENSVVDTVRLGAGGVVEYCDVSKILCKGEPSADNVLVAKNRVSQSVEMAGCGNSVVLGNVFTGGAGLSIRNSAGMTAADNLFDAQGGVHLESCDTVLVTGNMVGGQAVMDGTLLGTDRQNEHIYGSNISGEGAEKGADLSMLPAIDPERFGGEAPRDTVRIAGEEISLRSYLNRTALEEYEVILPPGKYRTGNWNLAGTKELTVLGYGVYLQFPDYTQMAVTMTGCSDVALKGICIDHEQVANAQGTVVETWEGGLLWKADAGYQQDLLDPSRFTISGTASPAGEGFRAGSEIPFADVAFAVVEATETPGEFRLQGLDAGKFHTGDKIVFRGKTAHVNYLTECENILYEDVTVFNGSGFAFMEYGGVGRTHINRMECTPGPKPDGADAERLISTCDATHSTNMRVGPVVTNCLFENMTDDAANVNGTYGGVLSYDPASRELVYGPGPKGYVTSAPDFLPGDIAKIYTLSGRFLGESVVESGTRNVGSGAAITLADSLSLEVKEGETILVNASANGAGFVYDNCLVQNNRSRGILVKAPGGRISNCTFRHNGMSAILVKPEINDGWGECGFVDGLVIENNLMESGGFFTGSTLHSPISVLMDATAVADPAYQNHTDIEIRGNLIRNRYTQYAVAASGVSGLTVTDNVFEGRAKQAFGDSETVLNPLGPEDDNVPSIWITASTAVTVGGNKYPRSVQHPLLADSLLRDLSGEDTALLARDRVDISVEPVFADGAWRMKATVTGVSGTGETGWLRLLEPEKVSKSTWTRFAVIGASAQQTVYFTLGQDLPQEMPFVLECVLEDGTRRVFAENLCMFSTVKAEEAGGWQGTLWNTAPVFEMGTADDAVLPNGWKGKQDLSASLRFAWDDQFLYVGADVRDDVHSQKNTQPENIWNGDSLQVSVDTGRAFDAAGAGGYAEFGFALGSDGKQYGHCWNNTINAAQPGMPAGVQWNVVRDEQNKTTRYEAAIPWSRIGVNGQAPGADALIGLAALINEDDGQGQTGSVRLFDGIGSGKYPEKFGLLRLQTRVSCEAQRDTLTEMVRQAQEALTGQQEGEAWEQLRQWYEYGSRLLTFSALTQDEADAAAAALQKALEAVKEEPAPQPPTPIDPGVPEENPSEKAPSGDRGENHGSSSTSGSGSVDKEDADKTPDTEPGESGTESCETTSPEETETTEMESQLWPVIVTTVLLLLAVLAALWIWYRKKNT